MDPETKLLRAAVRRYSVFSNVDAVAVGMSASTIKRRVATGRWRSLHRGVYIPASIPVDWRHRVMGALVACGRSAVVSHRAASAVWGLSDAIREPEITVPAQRRSSRSGIKVYRSARLDAAVHEGFRVTSPMRTLLDLAGREPEEVVERALDDAHRRGLVNVDRFAGYLSLPFCLARPGSAKLRAMVAVRDPKRAIGSDLETLMFRALRRAGLPLPVAQHRVLTRAGPRFVDFAYPDERVAIELDGYRIHSSRDAFEDDRVRQNQLEELGWHVLRFTWTQVTADPIGVAVTVGVAIGLSPQRWVRRRA